jgi:serine/threonine protein kinase
VRQRVGQYEISPLGAAAWGRSGKRGTPAFCRNVAIKFSRQQFSDRFEREARAIAQLDHPNICMLYDIGMDYLVMEFVDDQSLKGPLSLLKIIDYAHKKGIIHRDLKPANIIVANGRVKLLDFALVRIEAPLEGGSASAILANHPKPAPNSPPLLW